jgi:hypothetical protein
MLLAQHVFDNAVSMLPAQLAKANKAMTMQTS